MDRRILYLWASQALADTVDSGVMAVLLGFDASEGWRISGARGVLEGKDLRVTAEDHCLLLDGVLSLQEDEEAVCLLEVEWVREGCGEATLCIQWDTDIPEKLYVLAEDQSIASHGFHICPGDFEYELNPVTDRSTETKGDLQEDTCRDTEADGFDEMETKPLPETHEAPVEETLTDPKETEVFGYLGCQETAVRDGTYAVRFLFGGEVIPWIVSEGGGVLYAEICFMDRVEIWNRGDPVYYSLPDGGMITVLTFRGLQAARSYRFGICTENLTVWETYQKGIYVDSSSEIKNVW